MNAETTRALTLRPMGNAQGGYYFLALIQVAPSQEEYVPPTFDEVIQIVNAMVHKSRTVNKLSF